MLKIALLFTIFLTLAFLMATLQTALSSTLAQTTGQIHPLLINIQQKVPVNLTLDVPLSNGEIETVEMPITLDVNLQIGLSEEIAATIDVSQVAEPTIRVAEVSEEPKSDILAVVIFEDSFDSALDQAWTIPCLED